MSIEAYDEYLRRLRTRDEEGQGERPWWSQTARTPEERIARIESLLEKHRGQLRWLLEALGRAAPAVLQAFEDARRAELEDLDDPRDDDDDDV